MLDRALVAVTCLVILLIAILNFSKTLSGIPVFDKQARIQSVLGEWRVPVSSAYYNRSDYLFQLGYGFVHGDVVAGNGGDAQSASLDPTLALERSEKAITLLQKSLELAPGNAHAWETLAWAHALSGDYQTGLRAMSASWSLAPNNFLLARSRLIFVKLIFEFDDFGTRALPTNIDNEGISRDLKTLAYYSLRGFQATLEGTKYLKNLAELNNITARNN